VRIAGRELQLGIQEGGDVLKTANSELRRALLRLRDSIRNGLVQDVPLDDAICEFDCRRPECPLAEWATCRRRLEMAAGELMPMGRPSSLDPQKPQLPATLVQV
jgi:hypothetical protein